MPEAARTLAADSTASAPLRAIADSLIAGSNGAVLLGNLAQHHPQAATLHRLAADLAQIVGARVGFLGEAANRVGGHLAGAVPFGAPTGLDARRMLIEPRRAYVLWNTEPELDCHNPRLALAAMRAAEFVVALSPFRHLAGAHVLLPTAPYRETAGTFINMAGRVQSFQGAVKPLEETRPGWKVLRVLGNLLGLTGFEYNSAEEVKAAVLDGRDVAAELSNAPAAAFSAGAPAGGIERIAEVPIYFADALARRAAPLQMTRDARPPTARMAPALMQRLGLADGDRVRVLQDGGEATLPAQGDAGVPPGCVRIAAAHPLTADLGDMFGTVTLERVPVIEKVPA